MFTLLTLTLPRRAAQIFLAGAAVVRLLIVRHCSVRTRAGAGALLALPYPGVDALLALSCLAAGAAYSPSVRAPVRTKGKRRRL